MCHASVAKRYKKGAVAKTNPETNSIRYRPILSDKNPAGKLKRIPVNAEIPAMNPTSIWLPPICVIKRGREGFLEIVELKTANKPMTQRILKGDNLDITTSKYEAIVRASV